MPLRIPVLARKTHKWIGLFLGVQVVIWSLSGLYMTAIHIDTIHGDHLVRPAPERTVAVASLLDPVAVAASHGGDAVRLAFLDARPLYVVRGDGTERAYDARTGQPAIPPTGADIRRLATSYYTGNEPIASARLLTEIPREIGGRKPPIWRVEFDQWNKPTLYLSPVTGELLSRRHELWRIFDFVWMLHIMDYETRENVNNLVLRVFTIGAVLMSLSGIWLLFFAFPRKKKKKVADR
jgi:uncharacterized iron-regulated membrane protein